MKSSPFPRTICPGRFQCAPWQCSRRCPFLAQATGKISRTSSSIDDIRRGSRAAFDAHNKPARDINGAGGKSLKALLLRFGEDSERESLSRNTVGPRSRSIIRQKNGEQYPQPDACAAPSRNGVVGLFRQQIRVSAMSVLVALRQVLLGRKRLAHCVDHARSARRLTSSRRSRRKSEVKRFLERQPAFPERT